MKKISFAAALLVAVNAQDFLMYEAEPSVQDAVTHTVLLDRNYRGKAWVLDKTGEY